MRALILFYFKIEINDIDNLVKYWGYIEDLSKNEVLPMATNPLKFK